MTPVQYIQYKKAKLLFAQDALKAYGHTDTRGEWFYGDPGTGKSRAAFEAYPDAFRKA